MDSGHNFDRLPELHALACGLKALVTQEVSDTIDVLRRSCGGHGFMSSSNLPRLWGLVTASCTYEGENTVLQLQVMFFCIVFCLPLHSGGKCLKSRRFSIQKPNEKNCPILIRYTKKKLDVFQRHHAFIFPHFFQFKSSSDSFFPI